MSCSWPEPLPKYLGDEKSYYVTPLNRLSAISISSHGSSKTRVEPEVAPLPPPTWEYIKKMENRFTFEYFFTYAHEFSSLKYFSRVILFISLRRLNGNGRNKEERNRVKENGASPKNSWIRPLLKKRESNWRSLRKKLKSYRNFFVPPLPSFPVFNWH